MKKLGRGLVKRDRAELHRAVSTLRALISSEEFQVLEAYALAVMEASTTHWSSDTSNEELSHYCILSGFPDSHIDYLLGENSGTQPQD